MKRITIENIKELPFQKEIAEHFKEKAVRASITMEELLNSGITGWISEGFDFKYSGVKGNIADQDCRICCAITTTEAVISFDMNDANIPDENFGTFRVNEESGSMTVSITRLSDFLKRETKEAMNLAKELAEMIDKQSIADSKERRKNYNFKK